MFRLLFIMSPMDSSYKLKEVNMSLQEKYNDEFSIELMDTYTIDENPEEFNKCMREIQCSDIIFITAHGGISYFKSLNKIMDKYQGKKKFFIHSGLDDENNELFKKSSISKEEYIGILNYFLIGDTENLENMILHLAKNLGEKNYKVNSPKYPKWEGIYYPGKNIENYEEYIEGLRNNEKPIIAILFYSKYMHENNVEHIDRFIKEIENLQGQPLAIYTSSAPNLSMGCKGFQWVVDNILMKDGKSQVDAIINTIGYSQSILSNPGDGTTVVDKSIFENIKVPVFQGLNTYQSFENWENSLQGVDMMSLTGSVYYPEFDGQIITVTTSYCEKVKDEIGEKLVFKPIKERINKVCRLALNWAKLRVMENKNKKVAIIFHNMPPRNDMIGCAFGLDTPATVFNIVEKLKSEGVYTEYDFENGDEIINRIIDAVSNDMRWLSPERAIEKSVDIIEGNLYRKWFSNLSEKVQNKMTHDWDTPPGEFMVFNDKLPIPGIINGNIFIGLQPPRGYEEKADEVYHSTDIVPPHQYIAFYKWVKNVFKADVIAHIGTHGTLEWLPGKEVGLSKDCYTDIAIDDMPHIYPYSINVVGEGIQVKRRGNGVILDHLIPSLMQSGTYGEMENVDDLIKQYYHAKQGDNTKVKHIEDEIVNLVVKNNYHIDLNMSKEEIKNDFNLFMERFHGWIEEIKNSLIKDGLHIFGKVPEEERFENLVSALLRISNSNILSLIEGVCIACELDYEYLKDNPYDINNAGKTNLMLLDEMEEISRDIINKIHKSNYEIKTIEDILKKYFKVETSNLNDLRKTLEYACTVVKDKLNGTTDEIKYFINAVNGEFVPPGGSGSPTRGRVDILTTGRNFYSIDPTSVPTRASWKVGKQLGDNLISKYLNDEGKYPETVVMIVYSGETMKTCGDDISQALYLMGIKPKWLGDTDKVIGLEVIPLQELKRPRIDVTLRISGLFRDTFPNIIELVEDAVNLASSLDESDDTNYIRKNILSEINNLIKSGIEVEKAQQQASLRIFGCPPGTYGAGVDTLINSKNWNDVSDLGNVYALWGGHAYGRKIHGDKLKDVFAKRLSLAQVTVKNESSQEIDMLDSDDFYNYHGGLIAAVRTFSGKMPKSYCGDTSDPSRAKVKEVKEETARIMRCRILNPKWFEGLKPHGYKGAQEISGMVDFVFGWDATADVVEDWMYEKISETYLFDDEKREWIKSVNSWAIHSMSERLLEANQRGMWNANKESVEKLRQIYMDIEGDIEDYV
ncbi:cobaltochelatase subunit CobN [Clostridium senegalense]|uniref:Cobaltochelatase subunit CobN n=1 Tax=Clostridium senegalense TaxID=1465809 RepID=A0A6M0H1H3_9CLOT|nr:cobaltochelatase subunit CobN [Clostridium senegalense]NEU04605.1 cobaltochelatase subunit CobN [Clostridium senegalense]